MASPLYRYVSTIRSSVTSLPLPVYPHSNYSSATVISTPVPPYPYASSINSTNTTLPAYKEEPDVSRLLGDDKLEKDVDLPILEGWPLGLTVFSLCLALLLATLDTTIISTSLITIASDLGHFDKASWVVVAYLLTYSGFLIIFTRLSDIFGRKPVLLFAVVMFLAWSIGCGCARTIEQMIIFRALQGIGGAGIYALAYASILDVVPFRLVSAASGAISMSTACAGLLGPILGGVITSNTTWRWVFWLNVPCGVVVTISIVLIFPGVRGSQKCGKSQFKQIDWIGTFLSLAGSSLLVVSLEEGGIQFAWSSVAIIMMLVGSAICFTGFGIWETILTPRELKWKMLPLFPTRLVSHRVIAATLATVFFTGFPFVVTVISLPQRFQIVNNNTPAKAGLHMLPLIITTALGAIVTGTVTSKFKIAWHLLVSANALMSIGCGLMSTLPTEQQIAPLAYVYQTILGLGFGLTMASSMVVARTEVALKDNGKSNYSVHFGQLGGVIGYAATQAVLNQDFRSKLIGILSAKELTAVLLSTSNISLLNPTNAALTREAYGHASNLQMRAVMGFALAAFVASLFAWQSKPQDLRELEAERIAIKEGKSRRPASIIRSRVQGRRI
ncbi:hypothetical protein G7Y89_g13062 [Cudoniella acicularis]|uniref:Major facilitator superfamily (MFS) profile domain-containing protein n=1 Tax=Cudoniella acicularis TaxID=354080 RepID=A0A8H4VWS5_9HELO|nr:hypothetical protein G7Y89_g13062 [Cudoniella acicularis]